MGFIDVIKAKAKADKKTIVLPESMDRRTWVAAEKILKEDLQPCCPEPWKRQLPERLLRQAEAHRPVQAPEPSP